MVDVSSRNALLQVIVNRPLSPREISVPQASNSGNVSLKYLWPQRQHAGVGASDQHEAAVGAPLTAGVPLGERLTRDGCACCVLCDGHEAPRGEEHVLERDRRLLALGRDGDACVRRLHMGVGGVLLYVLWYTRYGILARPNKWM